MANYRLTVVIPCFNEERSLVADRYLFFCESIAKDVMIIFVDDASTDKTSSLLNKMSEVCSNIVVITNEVNLGKAASVMIGVKTAFQKFEFDKIAFLDGDLAAPLLECERLSEYIDAENDAVIGARILRVGANIQRNYFRHIVGRIIATLISKSLNLKIYDSQCGCKVFKSNIAKIIFERDFISKWLFDVELIFRIKEVNKKQGKKHFGILEIPLTTWVEYGDSKVSKWYFFKLFVDLYRINKQYN